MTDLKIKDVEEAAFLWYQDNIDCKGVDCKPNLSKNKTTIYFIFSSERSDEDVAELRRDYYNGSTTVEPREFYNCIGKVRRMLAWGLEKSKKNN